MRRRPLLPGRRQERVLQVNVDTEDHDPRVGGVDHRARLAEAEEAVLHGQRQCKGDPVLPEKVKGRGANRRCPALGPATETSATLSLLRGRSCDRVFEPGPRLFASSRSRFQLTDTGPDGEVVWSEPRVFDETSPEVVNNDTLGAPFASGSTPRLALLDPSGRVQVLLVGTTDSGILGPLFSLGWKGYAGGTVRACSVGVSADDVASASAVH